MGKKYIADAFVKNGATADDILVGDGSTTSKAALGGGGAGERDFVATGTIGAGAVVGLKSDGTVEIIKEALSTPNYNASVVISASTNHTDVSACYDTFSGKIVLFSSTSVTNTGRIRVGTVSGNTITFGTAVATGGETLSGNVIATPNGDIVIVYSDVGDSYKAKAIIGRVSGTSITLSTPVLISNIAANNSLKITPIYDSINNKVVIYYCSSIGYGIVGTISGGTISFGTEVQFSSSASRIGGCLDPISGNTVVVYRKGNNYLAARVGIVSGNSISFGTNKNLNSFNQGGNSPSVIYLPTLSKFVVVFGGGTYIQAITFSVSTSTITVINTQNLSILADTGVAGASPGLLYDQDTDRLIISVISSTYYINTITATHNGTSLTEESVTALTSTASFFPNLVYDSVNNLYVSIYEDNAVKYSVFNQTQVATNVESTIGINTTAKVNAETATVTILAGTSGGHSALVIGDICYVNYQGTITQTLPTDAFGFKRLGIAVSATEILLDLQETNEQITITESQISDLQAYLLTVGISDLKAELGGSATLPTGNNVIDFEANIQYDKTLDAAWAPTFTNPIKGKSIVIIATGANAAYTLTVPATIKGDISGFDGTKTNQLTLYCLDATTPVYSIDIKTW